MFTKTKKLIVVVAVVAAAALLWLVPYASQAQAPPPSQAISAPTLTAVAGEEAIDLSWNAVENAVRYELWAYHDEWELLDDTLTTTSYRHTELQAGAKWFYTVRAFDAQNAYSP